MTENRTAERVKARMSALEIDQSELARRVGCTSAAINQIVLGRTRHSRLLPIISRELGLPLSYLSGETDDPEGDDGDKPLLTSDETELLALFRAMTRSEQAAILTLARSAAAKARSSKPERS